MEFNPQWITLVSALTAMVAAVAGLFVNSRIAQNNFKANVLSTNRQKWIEAMRDLVASLNSQMLATAVMRHTIHEPPGTVIAKDPEMFRRVESLLRTVAKIDLMLNPLEQQHRQLSALIRGGIDQLRSPSGECQLEERIEGIGRDIIELSQEILKREWRRVKRAE